jgi:uncharacterized LabA/DUF88 family protein
LGVISSNQLVAPELRRQANEFIDLANLIGAIGRDPGKSA